MRASTPTKIYSSGYDDPSLRGQEAERPWQIVELIRAVCSSNLRLLDVGCGTCRKILPLADDVSQLCGLEPSAEMRRQAVRLAQDAGVANLRVVGGSADALPFPDATFGVVTSILAPHDTQELWRVLQPGGVAVVEKLGERDKANIKEVFGGDQDGPRGQFLYADGERQEHLRQEFERCFASVELTSGKWRTVLSMEGLVRLCEETNTIRNFDSQRDSHLLEIVRRKLSSEHGIETTQHRIVLVATKEPA